MQLSGTLQPVQHIDSPNRDESPGLTSHADPLRLALVFGIDHSTAMTDANLARQILANRYLFLAVK